MQGPVIRVFGFTDNLFPVLSWSLQALKTVVKKSYVPHVSPENIQDILDKFNPANARSGTVTRAENLHLTTLSLDKKTAEAFTPHGFAYNPMDEDHAEFLRWQSAYKVNIF